MKKVVLLAGALATGLAATSLNANAGVPVAPNVQETNASDQQVAEMTYDKYHASVDVAIKWLYDLEVEFTAAEIDADAKKEILADIEKRSLELSGYTEVMENAWHEYEVDRTDPAKLTALQTALSDVEAKLATKEVVFPTETQIKTNLRDRYYHIAKDWKIYKDNVTRGNKLLAAFQDLMDDQYKQIDEVADVQAAKLAVEQAHEKYREDNKAYHADRWFEQNPKNWEPVSADHGTKPCCTDKEADLETLYQTLVTKKGDFETLLNKYYTAKETLTSKLETSNQAETAELTADPATYTQSVDGKAWVKAAQQKVNDAQKAAEDFIKTYNAANPAVWSNPASVDQLKGEDGNAPAFKKESEYERRANELITAVDNAIKDLDAAVKEAKANEQAYKDGNAALDLRQGELNAIKTAYYDKNKEHTTGKVYKKVIDDMQKAIDDARTGLKGAWNTWKDKTVVPVDPKNAVEHLAGVTVDGVAYAKLKQDIADLLKKIQDNEAANDKIHEMTEALKGHYNELKTAVAGYEDVSLSSYTADGLCAHGEYLGTTSLDNLLKKFIEDEQKKYDAIASDAYLKDETAEGPTAKKNALDHELEMTWNQIATDQCAKYLAKIEAEYSTKHAYCEGLDDVCNEVEGEGAPCTCSTDDRQANPCGWCDATARGMHDAIETAKSEMDGKIQDWHFATDAKNHVAEVKTYKDDAFTAIENWVKTFEEADRLHDKNLDDLKVIVDKAIHNVHEVYADARHDLDNYKEADLAAANLWAQGKYGVDFKGYVQLLEELYEAAQPAADEARAKHHFTVLKGIGAECDQYTSESDYRDAVKKNTVDYNTNLATIADLETLLNSVVINKEKVYGSDYLTLDATYQEIAGLIDTARTNAAAAYNAGKAAEYAVPSTIFSAITALQEALKTAENLYAANVAAKAELEGLFADKTEQLNELVVLAGNLGDTVYASDADAIKESIQNLQSDGEDNFADFADFQSGVENQFTAKTLAANKEDFKDLLLDLQDKLDGIKTDIADAVKFKAANVKKAAEVTAQYNNLLTEVKTIVYGDVYGKGAGEEGANIDDAAAIDQRIAEIKQHLENEIGFVAQDLAEGVVTTTDYTEPIANYTADIKGLNGFIKDCEKVWTDNVNAREALTRELNDAETLYSSVVVSMHSVYGDDFDKLDVAYVQPIADMLDTERTNIAAAFDGKVAPEYTINSQLAVKIANFQTAVKQYEEFLRDNKEKATELTNDLTNLLTVLDGMHKYGDVYPEDKAIIDYLLDNADMRSEVPEGVRAAVLGLVEQVKAEVANVAQDLTDGLVLDNYENYKEAIGYIKTDIENLKQVIAEAETLYAENLDAWNKLDTHTAAIRTTINELEANSKCADCDEADNQALEVAKTTLENIANAYTSRFNVEKDLNDGRVYMGFEGDLNGVEETVKGIKKDMQDHFDLVRTSEKAKDNILDKMIDFEFILSEAQALEGADSFLEKDPENCNQDVLYFDEIRQAIADLKAEVEYDNSHEGGHQAFANYNAYNKQIQAIKDQIKTLEAAIAANNAAHELIKAQYAEIEGLVGDAMDFFAENYMEKTNDDILPELQEWIGTVTAGEPGVAPSLTGGKLNDAKNSLHNDFEHGSAAYKWTVDAQGQEFTDAVKEDVETQKFDIESMRNNAAKYEALNHIDLVRGDLADFEETYLTSEQYANDPFIAEVRAQYAATAGEYNDALDAIEFRVQDEWRGRTLEEALNIDEHSREAGIHQALEALGGNVDALEAIRGLYEDCHHLTNGKSIYSDQEYFTIGFFRQANIGLGEQAEEMFKTVKVNFDPVAGNIGIYDMLWLETYEIDSTRGPIAEEEQLPEYTEYILAAERDERDHLVHQEGLGFVPYEAQVLVNGEKSNELAFELRDKENARPVVTTLAAGPAELTFQAGSLTVNDAVRTNGADWTTKHPVYVEFTVEAPQVEEGATVDATAGSNKLVVRISKDAPVDLTYTINSLVARTDNGEELSFADFAVNGRNLEVTLPEGTKSVELPEGFFTFRTGENTIARSAACTVYVGGATSIDALIAMGEKVEIFDLQGRRVKAESLVSGNTYVVNGEKVMVK